MIYDTHNVCFNNILRVEVVCSILPWGSTSKWSKAQWKSMSNLKKMYSAKIVLYPVKNERTYDPVNFTFFTHGWYPADNSAGVSILAPVWPVNCPVS